MSCSVIAAYGNTSALGQNDRIQKFDARGAYVATIGSSSTLNHR
jgi:hypothetical protein